MTNWTQLIPARLRTTLYIGFGVLSLTQTAVLAYTAAVGLAAPLWAIGGGAVLGVIGGAFGFVAAGNTDVAESRDGRHEADSGYPISDEHEPTQPDENRYP